MNKIASVLAMFLAVGAANAASVTFAQFDQESAANAFVFTNSGSGIRTFTSTQLVKFDFLGLSLPAELQSDQDATLTVNATTSQPGAGFGGFVVQPFNLTSTISFTRSTPASVGNGARTNLLTVEFSNASILGNTGAGSASLQGDSLVPGSTLVFTSDFLDFTNTNSRNFSLSFSSVTPALQLGSGGFLRSFRTAGTGTFASDPPPVSFNQVPEPSTYAITGAALLGISYAFRRLRNRG